MDTTTGAKESQISYEKRKWREWCVLHDREDKGERILEVENTSFTGADGCELIWHVKVNKSAELELKQKAGKIFGKGPMFDLSIELAAGKINWTGSNMPVKIQLASGTIEWKADGWPKKQKSTISVASGSIYIESPKGSPVTTHISNAVGSSDNAFSAQHKDYHQLLIEMAAGKVVHSESDSE